MSICATERRIVALAALCCMAAASSSSMPTVLRHKVKRGDSLSALAIRHYGTVDSAEWLARVNGLQAAWALQVGQTLRIPISSRRKIQAGDTASRLAEKHLGGASRHALLLELNGLAAGAVLAAGAEIEIPVLLEHIVQRGETLGTVAKQYYGDAARASWLVACNGITKPDEVRRGARIQVPLVGFLPAGKRRSPETPPSAAKAPVAAAAAPRSRSAVTDPAVERALQLYRQGEYRKARDLLGAALDTEALPIPERVRALRYRAYCSVALGERVEARQHFQKLHRQAPDWKPDPVEDSPKIRQIYSEAVGAPVTASKSPS